MRQFIQPLVTTTLATPEQRATMAPPVDGVATAPSRGVSVHLVRRDTADSDISGAATASKSQEVRTEQVTTEAARGEEAIRGSSREQDYNLGNRGNRRGRDTCKCSRSHVRDRRKQTRISQNRGAERSNRKQEQHGKFRRERNGPAHPKKRFKPREKTKAKIKLGSAKRTNGKDEYQ